MLGLRGDLLRGGRLTDRLLGLGLPYRHRLGEDLFGEALEEPCSGTLPHLGEKTERMKTGQPSTKSPAFTSAGFSLCSLPTIQSPSQFLFDSHNSPKHSVGRA